MLAGSKVAKIKWAVAWVAKGRIIRKDFGYDFSSALELYTKAERAGKRAATLICLNRSVEPPPNLQPHVVRKLKKEIVVRKRKRYLKKKVIEGTVVPLKRLNAQGIWWCTCCGKLRKFTLRKGFDVDGVWVPQPGYHCPLCGVSHRDFSIRYWNPVATRLYVEPLRAKRSRTPRRRTRRRRK